MQRPKKVPLRKCVGCQQQHAKRELIRVVHTPDGAVELDLTGRKNGRGAYVCRKMDCFKLARKKKSLERALKTAIPESVFDELEFRLEGALAADGQS
ncbi:hypothetical protein GCM10025857_03520 [Alicyclobacillus contaminans]|uniref:RNase P modulator RnpM n=1 Tax=Alicyclobacillus contaminans TaxID=392016 RepID=UPI000429FF81|nr:YlxR family protein [Alicyclobacillus contaminans]GMA48995.1 hypothetical protein GCM10025857_03520 [Alicyclobacillus contaminans]